MEIIQRIYSNSDKIGNCLIWGKAKSLNGYGFIKYNRKQYYVHRLVYKMFYGKLTNGLQIDHLCGNRDCVNIEHLEEVTPRENTLRSNNIAAKNSRKQKCKRGHLFTKSNTRIIMWKEKPTRHCKKCLQSYHKDYYVRFKKL